MAGESSGGQPAGGGELVAGTGQQLDRLVEDTTTGDVPGQSALGYPLGANRGVDRAGVDDRGRGIRVREDDDIELDVWMAPVEVLKHPYRGQMAAQYVPTRRARRPARTDSVARRTASSTARACGKNA